MTTWKQVSSLHVWIQTVLLSKCSNCYVWSQQEAAFSWGKSSKKPLSLSAQIEQQMGTDELVNMSPISTIKISLTRFLLWISGTTSPLQHLLEFPLQISVMLLWLSKKIKIVTAFRSSKHHYSLNFIQSPTVWNTKRCWALRAFTTRTTYSVLSRQIRALSSIQAQC